MRFDLVHAGQDSLGALVLVSSRQAVATRQAVLLFEHESSGEERKGNKDKREGGRERQTDRKTDRDMAAVHMQTQDDSLLATPKFCCV